MSLLIPYIFWFPEWNVIMQVCFWRWLQFWKHKTLILHWKFVLKLQLQMNFADTVEIPRKVRFSVCTIETQQWRWCLFQKEGLIKNAYSDFYLKTKNLLHILLWEYHNFIHFSFITPEYFKLYLYKDVFMIQELFSKLQNVLLRC